MFDTPNYARALFCLGQCKSNIMKALIASLKKCILCFWNNNNKNNNNNINNNINNNKNNIKTTTTTRAKNRLMGTGQRKERQAGADNITQQRFLQLHVFFVITAEIKGNNTWNLNYFSKVAINFDWRQVRSTHIYHNDSISFVIDTAQHCQKKTKENNQSLTSHVNALRRKSSCEINLKFCSALVKMIIQLLAELDIFLKISKSHAIIKKRISNHAQSSDFCTALWKNWAPSRFDTHNSVRALFCLGQCKSNTIEALIACMVYKENITEKM